MTELENLLERYRSRVKNITDLIIQEQDKEGDNDVRLNTKLNCYKEIVIELEKVLKHDVVVNFIPETIPLNIAVLSNTKQAFDYFVTENKNDFKKYHFIRCPEDVIGGSFDEIHFSHDYYRIKNLADLLDVLKRYLKNPNEQKIIV